VPASVGFIALLGIAVLNGVVMVTYFNQLLARGMGIAEVVVEGASAAAPGADDRQHRRLRPGPDAVRDRPRSEVQRPLAIVVIGGLVTSTALTLVLLPILFRRFGVEPAVSFSEKSHG
jgi:cobalt-zinc-cadmium resistance protein CzcA